MRAVRGATHLHASIFPSSFPPLAPLGPWRHGVSSGKPWKARCPIDGTNRVTPARANGHHRYHHTRTHSLAAAMTVASASSATSSSPSSSSSMPRMVPVLDKPTLSAQAHWRREFVALLQTYEPASVQHAQELLDAYEGLERELVQCYRHYYTGAGGFRVASQSVTLPREAIDTFLRLQLRARRTRSFADKSDGTRDVEVAAPSATTSPSGARLLPPRPRAASTSALVRAL